MKPKKFLCVCSGISAPTAAWKPLGFEAIGYAEIDPFACAVLSHRHGAGRPRFMPQPEDAPTPEDARKRAAAIKALDKIEWGSKVRNEGDFTRLRDEPWIEEADVLVGGTPCQAFSLAGLRKSLSDDRGNLSLEFIRLADAIDDLRRASGKRPALIVWENVPGVFSTKDNAFGAFLAGLVGSDQPINPDSAGGWTDAGVVAGPKRVAAWRVLNAQHFGVAQRRRRVFVFASGDPGAWVVADALLPIIDSMCGDPAPRRTSRAGLAGGLGRGAEDEGRGLDEAVGGGAGSAGSGGGDQRVGPGGIPLRADRRLIEPLVMAHGQASAEISEGLSPTLTCNHEAPIVAHEPIPFDLAQVTSPQNGSRSEPGDPAPTLNAQGKPPAIAYAPEVSPTLLAGANKTGGARPPGSTADNAESLIAYAPEQSGPLMAGSDGAGPRTTDLEGGALVAIGFSSKDYGADAVEDLAPTLRAMNNDKSHANFGGQIAVAFSLRGRDGENVIEPEAGDVAPALRTGEGGSSKPFVAYNLMPAKGGDSGYIAAETEVANAITAEGEASKNGRGLHIVQGAVNIEHGLAPKGSMKLRDQVEEIGASEDKGHTAVVFKSSHYTRGKDGAPSDLVPALSADADKGDQDPLVFVAEVAGTLTSASSSPAAKGKVNGTDRAELVGMASAVRRLTCRECERLQGFPDDFTLIPWVTGSKRDEEDLAETILYLRAAGYGQNEAAVLATTPDGPRYRVLGNSMARTVLQTLGERIVWAFEMMEEAA